MPEATTTDARRETAQRMSDAAAALLAALPPGLRAKAQLGFEGDARERWHYTPNIRAGLPLLEMDPQQQIRAHRLVATGLSVGAYVTAASIMGLENVLHMRERWRTGPYPGTDGQTRWRDPLMYYVAIHGDPGAETWAWQFGGHHVSLNYTIHQGSLISPTPTFFGADPAEVGAVGRNGLRPLAGEEDLGRELVHLLTPAQRAVAIISPAAPFDMVQSNRPRVEDGALPRSLNALMGEFVPEAMRQGFDRVQATQDALLRPEDFEALRYSVARPAGLAATAMSEGQRDALTALLRQYILRMPDDLAEVEWGAIEEQFTAVHFAWAGPIEKAPGSGHYYRVQAPRFLVEYDNVQNGANHIHSVWRDPGNDFGHGTLAAHYASAHR